MEIKLLSCPLCTTPHFKDVDNLRNTLVTIATSLVTCPVCKESFLGLDKLTIHLFSHIGSKIEVKDNLQDEIERKISDESLIQKEGPVKCDICTFSFSDKHILDIHQKLLHQTTPDINTGNYSYHCHLCSKKFKMKGSLMVHLRVAHYGFIRKESNNKSIEVPQHINTDNNVKVNEKNGQKIQDNKQWECDVCSKLFTTKYFLKKHKRLHTGEMPYCCSLCNKSFTFQQSYHKHMLYHSSEKPHTCNECGRSFKELSTLQNHARIHSGERPFVCETCGKSFRQRVSYLVHRRIHTGVMPYKCTICNKSFRYKVSQKSHKCQLNSPEQPRADQTTTTSEDKCIMNVDLNTGSISVIPQKEMLTKSILLNNNEVIEISYNKSDIKENKQDELVYENPLSNLLPEVESLYLNNSPTNSMNIEPETINDMRDKCLEELLQSIE